MKVISIITVSKLIEAHYEKDEKKFLDHVNLLIDAFEEQGDKIGAEIIKSKINGTYKYKPKVVVLDDR